MVDFAILGGGGGGGVWLVSISSVGNRFVGSISPP